MLAAVLAKPTIIEISVFFIFFFMGRQFLECFLLL
jgi:hypothetical protein